MAAKVQLVPNGIDREKFTDINPDAAIVHQNELNNCILQVGWIGETKNQLGLIRALTDFPGRIVLVGKPSSIEPEYYHACQEEAAKRKNVLFIGHYCRNNYQQSTRRLPYMSCQAGERHLVWQAWKLVQPVAKSCPLQLALQVNISAMQPGTAIQWIFNRLGRQYLKHYSLLLLKLSDSQFLISTLEQAAAASLSGYEMALKQQKETTSTKCLMNPTPI